MDSDQPSSSIRLFSHDVISEQSNIDRNNFYSIIKTFPEIKRQEFFDIDGTVKWIESNQYSRIGLQFPDQLLQYSVSVAEWIEDAVKVKTFILADTSYRSCCIDDVAAEHANVDCIIHYGDACLSEYSGRFPIKFIFGHLPVDRGHFMQVVESNATKFSSNRVLLCDAMYSNYAEDLEKSLDSLLPSVINASISASTSECLISLGRRIPENFDDISEVTVIFVGEEDSPLLPLWLMTHLNCSSVFVYSPSTRKSSFSSSQAFRQLRRRLFLIEKVRDAKAVGMVVCSLGISKHREAVKRMRELCETADKKLYVLTVGKINVPKLSNFASDIDVFVIFSCPFGIILDASDYYQPIVSMFEAEIALNPSKEWAAAHGWTSEYRTFIDDTIGEVSDDIPDVSLVTGRIRGGQRSKNAEGSGCNQISLYNSGDYVGGRTWRGLIDTCTGEESTELHEGRKGIAAHYDSETERS